MVLLEFMDEDGAFKTATRGGGWPTWKRMLAEGVNEQYRMRASYHAAHSTKENDVRFDPSELYFLDPVERELRDVAVKQQGAETDQAVSHFNAELGFG